jgi:hypothetical protein
MKMISKLLSYIREKRVREAFAEIVKQTRGFV